jgi:hypothetical protein
MNGTITMHRRTAATLTLGLLLTVLTLAGCAGWGGGGGSLSVTSLEPSGGQLRGGFEQGIYRYDDRNTVTVVLFDGPADNPTQAVTIRMFWKPRAGRTPIDQTATNSVLNYVILPGDPSQEAGIYSGAGFTYPSGKAGGRSFQASVWEAHLKLSDASANFQDRLGPAQLTGGFSARRDDAQVDQVLRKLHVQLRQRLGYPRLVGLDGEVESGLARGE